jgi:Ca2+-binding EF-hand superfamily protein
MDEIQELLEDFLVEAFEMVEEMDQDLIELENNPDDLELLNKIFRVFMSDKKLRSLFKGSDLDNSGALDRGEIRALARRLWKNMGEHKLDAAMREMDRYAMCGLSAFYSVFNPSAWLFILAVMAMV